MAAGISTIKGKDGKEITEMMFVGQKPWHGLGTELKKLATAEEAMKAAHLDWSVEKRQAHFLGRSGKPIAMPGRYITVRSDTEKALGVVGKDYTVLQNQEAFQFCDGVVQEKAAIYETAGALWGGKKVWLLAKMDGLIKVKGNDVVERYLLLSNSHEGGCAFSVGLTAVRVVCQNTLNQAMADQKSFVKVQHSTRMGERIEAVREGLGIVNKQFDELKKKMERLAEVQVKKANFEVFAETLGWKPDAEKDTAAAADYEKLLGAFETSPGSNLVSAKGTLWGAVNAVTYYVDHMGNFKATQNGTAADNKLRSIWWGSGNQLKTQALNTALAMAK